MLNKITERTRRQVMKKSGFSQNICHTIQRLEKPDESPNTTTDYEEPLL